MSKKPVFGSPFEETISVPQLHRVKGETLVVGGCGLPVATSKRSLEAPTEAGAETELSDCNFLVFITLVFQLAKPRLKDFE